MAKKIWQIVGSVVLCYPLAILLLCGEEPIEKCLWMALIGVVLLGAVFVICLVVSYKKMHIQMQKSEDTITFSMRVNMMRPGRIINLVYQCHWHEVYVCIYGVHQNRWVKKYLAKLSSEDKKSIPGEQPGTETIILRIEARRLLELALRWDKLDVFTVQEPSISWDTFLVSCNPEGPVGSSSFYLRYAKKGHETVLTCTTQFAQASELSVDSLYEVLK